MTPEERFASKVRQTSTCWLWTGGLTPDGYGVFYPTSRRRTLAHVYAWTQANGRPVPAGLQLDHTCEVHACVNPAHLEPVTNAENQRRRAERSTTCRQGHPYAVFGRIRPDGKRTCKECHRLYCQRWREARRNALPM